MPRLWGEPMVEWRPFGRIHFGMNGMTDILQDRDGGIAIVTPTGRLDSLAAPKLQSALAALETAGERRLVIDLGRVDYISSAGLSVLFTLAKRLRENGGALALCGLGDHV